MLAIRQLAFRYAGATTDALADVSLAAHRGQVLGLLGPNGAGKTTLISHLSGALTLQHGEILVDAEPLARVRARTPTRITVAPQEFAFYPMLTVAQNLACFASAARINGPRRAQRLQACVESAQLERVVGMRAEQLSGGLKRRLNLAIALLPEPELVIFDEPTVGVDPQTRAFVLAAIKGLATRGAAVIYTSHYMEEVEAIADRVLILDQGRVLREGSMSELLSGGAMLLSISAEGLAPQQLRAVLAGFGELDSALELADPPANPAHLRLAPGHSPGQVFAAVEAAGGRVQHAEFGRGNLEHLFMALTHRSLRD